jgi:phosphoribosyl-AMP cyclohydrolase / phosphoribosyl-ATP pyrophosphohydrolase
MTPDFEKTNGLLPVIIQDSQTLEVLMLGYMNKEAYRKTIEDKRVTFYSRSKERLWTKGETSNNFFEVIEVKLDCDNDTLLIKVDPAGPACHTGDRSCFKTEYNQNFLFKLENIIKDRYNAPVEGSYINSLRKKGIKKIAQKVGEEGVETVISALNETDDLFINESSDLLFHLMVLLREKNIKLTDIADCLEKRHLSADEQKKK